MIERSTFFYPLLSIDDIESFKIQLMEIYELDQDEFHLYKSGIMNYFLPPVYHFSEFVKWVAVRGNVSPTMN